MSDARRGEGGPGGDASGPASPDRNIRGGEENEVEDTQIADDAAADEQFATDNPDSAPWSGDRLQQFIRGGSVGAEAGRDGGDRNIY